MKNVFLENVGPHSEFSWDRLGDIRMGRLELGEEMPVLVYRLMQYTMLDVLSKEFGEEQANSYFRKAGHLAGLEYARNVLDLDVEFDNFVAQLQSALKQQKIGIMRIEQSDLENGRIVLSVGEDLDCSGLPVSNEMVCTYDEGFIGGLLEAYVKKPYEVKEIDCWASGDRVCRFQCDVVDI